MSLVASRNLTTLLASCLMLHPNIQVLNHCPEINRDNKTNFLVKYTKEKLNNFIDKVFSINKESKAIVGVGGVITESHAFNGEIKKRFDARFTSTNKENIQSIFWKDSLKNTLVLKKADIDSLLKESPELRFIIPVRNPMDCATSNWNTGRARTFCKTSVEGILLQLILSYAWFFSLEEKYPDRFMHFFPSEINKDMLIRIEEFLQVPHDDKWVSDVMDVWKLRPSKYNHSKFFISFYDNLIKSHIKNKELVEKLNSYK